MSALFQAGRLPALLCIGALGIAVIHGCGRCVREDLHSGRSDAELARIFDSRFDEPLSADGRVAAAWSLLGMNLFNERVWRNPDASIILVDPGNLGCDHSYSEYADGFVLSFSSTGSLMRWSRFDADFRSDWIPWYGNVPLNERGYLVQGVDRIFEPTARPPIVTASWRFDHEP